MHIIHRFDHAYGIDCVRAAHRLCIVVGEKMEHNTTIEKKGTSASPDADCNGSCQLPIGRGD
jgi:hypothetical protein